MQKNSMWLMAPLTAILMLTGVVSWGATSTSTWATAANGDWTNASNWSAAGVPAAGSEARLTVGGGSYTSTWSGGGSVFESLAVTNTTISTATLNIDAAGFENSNGTVRLGRGARMYVRSGGVWRYSGSNTVAAPLIAIDQDAELHVDGGSMLFSNIVGKTPDYATLKLGTVAGSTGLLYVSSGRLEFRNNSDYGTGLRLGVGGCGQVYQSGGTVVIRGNSPYDFDLGNGAAGAVGEYNISGGVLLIQCYARVGSTDTKCRGVLRISGDGVVTNTGIDASFGIGTGVYGELNISGGKYNGPTANFGGYSGTGVLQMAGGQFIVNYSLRLGWNRWAGISAGQGTIGGGYMLVSGYGDGMNIGAVYAIDQSTRGVLTMTNGTVEIKGVGTPGWDHLSGLVLAYSLLNNVTGVVQGEFNLAGGAVTNDAYLLLGYNPGSIGSITQTGGRYAQTGTRPAVVGYGGGKGTLTISNGVFELSGPNQSLYVGGYNETNSLYNGVATNIDRYAGTGPSTGRLVVAGGTLRIPGSLVVGTNGQGTAVFSGGTTTATNLNLVGAGATLRFKLGAADAGTLTVTNMTVGAGAKLEVDASAYDMSNGRRVKLVGCGARTGSFSPENITTSGRAAVVDQASGANIWLKFNTGTIITIR